MKTSPIVLEVLGRAGALEASTSLVLLVVFCVLPKRVPSHRLCGGSAVCISKTAHGSVCVREKIPRSALSMSLFCVKIAYSC